MIRTKTERSADQRSADQRSSSRRNSGCGAWKAGESQARRKTSTEKRRKFKNRNGVIIIINLFSPSKNVRTK